MALPFGLDSALASPISLTGLTINLLIGVVLATILAYHYIHFGRTFGNRVPLAHVFVIMTLVTIFMISLAKSSFAVALGLLGALSIVRYRTPIKEPEELAYLFFSIAIGFGLGAEARLPTFVAFTIILVALSARSLYIRRAPSENLYLTIDVPATGSPEAPFESIRAVIAADARTVDIRRLDVRGPTLHMTFRVDYDNKEQIIHAISEVRRMHPEAIVSYIEQRPNVGA